MPEISSFFGIIVRMFPELGAPHHRPHFHVVYQEFTAVFALDPLECITGMTGLSCKPADRRSRLSHCVNERRRE
jgi:hypothetical protein